jgi:hypothetical protein
MVYRYFIARLTYKGGFNDCIVFDLDTTSVTKATAHVIQGLKEDMIDTPDAPLPEVKVELVGRVWCDFN